MKTRIASSVALAAALVLGMTGCSLISEVATSTPYAPSDGVDVTVGDVDLRNVMLIADETGENFNVVFGAVNRTGGDQEVSITFTGEGAQTASADFTVPGGSSLFGNPDGESAPVLVTLDGVAAGQTVEAYFQITGDSEQTHNVPVLDGTLQEYQPYVLPAGFGQAADESEEAVETEEADEAAAQSKVGDDTEAEESESAE